MVGELRIDKDRHGLPTVFTEPGREPDWSRPVCLLLHGYNVNAQTANTSYTQLFGTIRRQAGLPPFLQKRSWLVSWPAYASWGLGRGKTIFSPLTYPLQIPSAVDAADALKRYIDRSNADGVEITLLAHSLGCRVALELLDRYASSPGGTASQFPLVVLMAAAIPTYFFEDRERLWRGALLPRQTMVLFSGRDSILTGPFRVGQTIAGEGMFPKAVGATGRPMSGFWTHVIPTRNRHSGYFVDPTTAGHIAQSFGQAPPKLLPVLDETITTPDPPRILPQLELGSRSPL